MRLRSARILVGLLACLTGAGERTRGADEKPASQPAAAVETISPKAASQAALEKLNALVGSWRGAAQPIKNSTNGAWTEKAEWVWEIKKDAVAMHCRVEGGKLLETAVLSYDPVANAYRLQAKLPDRSSRDYSGKLAGNKLVLESAEDGVHLVHRLTLTLLNEKRTLALFEHRRSSSAQFVRGAEIGYTREGTSLATERADGPECIVTGGKGTASLVYKGKTYWFCCSGCRDAFEDDPERMIAEAATRAERKKSAVAK